MESLSYGKFTDFGDVLHGTSIPPAANGSAAEADAAPFADPADELPSFSQFSRSAMLARPSSAASQGVRIEWLRQAGSVFLPRFFSHFGEEILGAREEIIPSTFGFKFSQHERSEGLLLVVRQLCCFDHYFLENFAHGEAILRARLAATAGRGYFS